MYFQVPFRVIAWSYKRAALTAFLKKKIITPFMGNNATYSYTFLFLIPLQENNFTIALTILRQCPDVVCLLTSSFRIEISFKVGSFFASWKLEMKGSLHIFKMSFVA